MGDAEPTNLTTNRAEPRDGLRSARQPPSWLPDTSIGLVAGGLALVLPLLSIRVTDAPGWVGRYALLPIEAAIGIPLLFSLLRTRMRAAAIARLAFAGVATVSTFLSDNRAMSFWGNDGFGTGLLFVLAMVGMWAIGTSGGHSGRDAVEKAIVLGVLANAVIALVQVFVDLSSVGAANLGSQPTGLTGQPVQLAALLLGGLWLVLRRAVDGQRVFLVAAFVVAAAIEVSAERFPLVLCVPLVVLVVWRKPLRTAGLVVGVVAIGIVCGLGLTHAASNTTSATTRLAGDVGTTQRTENYTGALRALGHRSALGWGPGRYLAATAPERTVALEKANPDSLFVDAHNWPLQWVVTTGIVGLAALVAWLTLAAKRSSGPLVGFALCIAAVQLVQPQDVGTTALALLALGAAAAIPPPRSVVPLAVRGLLVVAGVVAAAVVLVGGWDAYRAQRGHFAQAAVAARVLPHWPDRAETAARLSLARDDLTPAERIAEAQRWAAEAVARDSRDPIAVGQAGYDYLFVDDFPGAEQTFSNLLSIDPHSPRTLTGLAVAELNLGKVDEAITHLQQSQAIDPTNQLTARTLAQALQRRAGS